VTDAEISAAAAKAFVQPFGGVIRLCLENGKSLWLDGRGDAVRILDADPLPADAPETGHCVWRASRDTLLRILEGERLLASAFVSGRLTIAGDMSVMARLQMERGS
jgi:putative sterol carrier protein